MAELILELLYNTQSVELARKYREIIPELSQFNNDE